MATSPANFRPSVWAEEFKDYFGQIPAVLDFVDRYDQFAAGAGKGETIQIPSLEVSAVTDIVPGSVSATLGTISDTGNTLTLDKFRGKPYPITVVDEKFNHPMWREAFLRRAAQRIKNDTNDIVLALAETEGTESVVTQKVNTAGGALTDADILEVVQKLDDAEFPEEDRYLVLPPVAVNDLAGIAEYISKDYGDGQSQHRVMLVRGLQVVKIPVAYFNESGGVYSGLAMHRSAIAAAIGFPHIRRVPHAGQYQDIMEIGVFWGQKICKATGLVRVNR
jgi:hypothetical protein